MEYLVNHPHPDERLKQLCNILKGDLQFTKISDVKVHVKLESLLKDTPATEMKDVQARIIVW